MHAVQDLEVMRDQVFFDGPEAARKRGRFWVLLILASVIAAAGVVADSTATVIGAMIVAPLMTPIQGTVLATMVGDRANLLRCLALVVLGAALAIAIGFVLGLLVVEDVVAATNSQVASRVHPGLIDLVAALATGVVGAVALARRDISDTLPGVAIAISLVPPLAVVGLTLEAGAVDQAAGALLLFVTNVAAILATGIVVLSVYGVSGRAAGGVGNDTLNRRRAVAVMTVLFILVLPPLSASTITIVRDTTAEGDARAAGEAWADSVGWEVVHVNTDEDGTVMRFEGPLPVPPLEDLRSTLEARGVNPGGVEVELAPIERVDLDG